MSASTTFTQGRLNLLKAANMIAQWGETDIERAQMRAIAGLAALAFHEIPNCPCGSDARALRDDLEGLWEVVDPLIEAIGNVAISELGVHRSNWREFNRQLQSALEGNATYVLESLADEMDETMKECAS